MSKLASIGEAAQVLGVSLLFFAIAATFLTVSGIRINLTDSMPLGFYRMTPGKIERGSIAMICPDLTNPAVRVAYERGYFPARWFACEGGVAPLLKPVLALPGDLVEVAQEGIRVNGQEIENSGRLASDSAGRPLPWLASSGEVPARHVWLFSNYSPASFDSRYFGTVETSAILGKMEPVAVLDTHHL